MEASDVRLDTGATPGPPGGRPAARADDRDDAAHRLGSLPPELALLLDLVEPARVARRAQGVDWGIVLALARQHRLSARLAAAAEHSPAMTSQMPDRIRGELRSILDQERLSQRRALRELDEVCAALVDAGIRPVVLKGAALQVRGLVEVGLRPLADLDLLVEPGKVDPAAQMLERLGFRSIGSATERAWARKHHYQDAPYRHPDHAFDVDLHWHIQAPAHRHSFSVSTLETREQILPSGTAVDVLDDVDLLTHLCLHFWNDREQGRPGSLGQLIDIAAVLRGFDEQAWTSLRERASRRRHERIIAACVAMCDLFSLTQATSQLPEAQTMLDDPRHPSFAIRRVLGTRPPQIQMLMVTPDVEYSPRRVATRVAGHLRRTWSRSSARGDRSGGDDRCRDLIVLCWRIVRSPWESAAEIGLDRWAHGLR